jgi:hypothetical protein
MVNLRGERQAAGECPGNESMAGQPARELHQGLQQMRRLPGDPVHGVEDDAKAGNHRAGGGGHQGHPERRIRSARDRRRPMTCSTA